LLRFVQKLTLTPDQITATDAEPIFAAGWDEQAFLDSIFICAIVNCVNRVVMGVGLDVDYSLAYKVGINGGQPSLSPGQ
jgi:alkylhydroperoxidase family enzyme